MSAAPGLSLKEQAAHGWTTDFALAPQSGGALRPTSPFFQTLICLEEGKGVLVLQVLRQALEHPTTGPELSRLRWAFLVANLPGSEAELKDWLAGEAKQPLKIGERKLERAEAEEFILYTLGKTRGKFWPFS